ncbi:hypothetical protein IIA16_01570 [bacterium]|nr:hypothetical protein [bacterium]
MAATPTEEAVAPPSRTVFVVDKSGTLHVLHSDTFYFERGLAHSWWNETKIGAGQD